jgi:hypothetical protein
MCAPLRQAQKNDAQDAAAIAEAASPEGRRRRAGADAGAVLPPRG